MRIVISIDRVEFPNDYVDSLLAAGADRDEIIALPGDLNEVAEAMSGADGLLLGGGEDVEPSRYDDTARFDNVHTNPDRDERELAAYQSAREKGLPVFGICRGLQLINVARGGTMIQDIPGEKGDLALPHQFRQKDQLAHDVRFDLAETNQLLRDCFPRGVEAVNSRHHQAIARLAPDLVVAGLAPDGIVEAVTERESSHPFFMAVQWHPENLPQQGGHGEIFRRFVSACRLRAAMSIERAEVVA